MVESIFLPIGSQLPLKCRLCLFRACVSLVSLGSNCLQMGYIIIIFFFKSKHIEDLIIRSFIYLYPSKRKVPIKTLILKDNLLMLIYKNDKDFETYTRNWFFFFGHWNCFCIQYYYITIFGLLVTSRLKSWPNRMKYRLLCSNHLFKILIAKLRPRYHRHCTEPEGIEQIWNLLRVKYLLKNVKEDIICISNAMVFLILPDIDYM